jgi:hypothetical protein
MSLANNNDLSSVLAYWNTLAKEAPDGCRDAQTRLKSVNLESKDLLAFFEEEGV